MPGNIIHENIEQRECVTQHDGPTVHGDTQEAERKVAERSQQKPTGMSYYNLCLGT
jgi:hypothetical protein